MSVRNYHYSLRDNPEERSSHILRGGSLKSCILLPVRTWFDSHFIGGLDWASRTYGMTSMLFRGVGAQVEVIIWGGGKFVWQLFI